MARVFDALRREQKRKKRDGEHDPLTQSIAPTGAPTGLQAGVAESEAAAREAETIEVETGFAMDSRIGTPAGPRSNEGMLLPGAGRKIVETDEQLHTPAQPASATTTTVVQNNAAPIVTDPTVMPVAPATLVHELANTFQQPQTREPERVAIAQARPGEIHRHLMMLHEPHASGCEQYRTLRTQLFHAAERELTQVIVVTSAIAGEGKTATTLNLALAIAQSPKRRVLVIDGDLRRPSVATYLAMKPFAGFAEVLNDKAELFDAITRLADHELYLLPVKRAVATPTELLSSARFQETLQELRQYFDFILIDSPPAQTYADTRLLANHADAVLMVVRAGFAPYETVEQAVQSLADSRILGVVLNAAEDVQEASVYADQQQPRERGEPSLIWSALAPRVRDSWLGRRLKL